MKDTPAASHLRELSHIQSACRRDGFKAPRWFARVQLDALQEAAGTAGVHVPELLENGGAGRYVQLLIDNHRVFRCRPGAHINLGTSVS